MAAIDAEQCCVKPALQPILFNGLDLVGFAARAVQDVLANERVGNPVTDFASRNDTKLTAYRTYFVPMRLVEIAELLHEVLQLLYLFGIGTRPRDLCMKKRTLNGAPVESLLRRVRREKPGSGAPWSISSVP